jgi:hypothetical protein
MDDLMLSGPGRDDGVADGGITEDAIPDGGITDEQLTELALAVSPGSPVDVDAVPLSVYLGTLAQTGGLLPQWYMPTPMARHASGWRMPVVLTIVAAFVVIEALGLCSVFGQLTIG